MKIAILDDLNTDRIQIIEYLNHYLEDAQTDLLLSIDEFYSGEAFLCKFTPNFWDLIFIDYYMVQLSGLETARKIRQLDQSVNIIFITTSRDFAIDSYKVKASGYLVKPISYEDFAETLSLLEWSLFYERRFFDLSDSSKKLRFLICDILYCDISGHYVQIHTLNEGTARFRMTFEKLSALLSPYSEFLLCYRGCLVNMNHICSMDDMNFHLTNGDRLPFRKKEHQHLTRTYSEFLFSKRRNKLLTQANKEVLKWN